MDDRLLQLHHLPSRVSAFAAAISLIVMASSTPLSAAPVSTAAAAAKLLPGRWQTITHDKETGVSETLVIEFAADGSYSTQLQSSHFKSPRFSARGGYAITDTDAKGFTLKITRKLEDPESDKADAFEIQRIEVVDDNTLKAADGAIVQRVK